MTGQELLTRLTQFGDIDVDSAQVIGWIDQCQREIAIDAGKIVRHTYDSVVANTEIALPTDYAALMSILVNNLDYSKTSRVILRADGYIIFPEDLPSVTITYHKIPDTYSDLTKQLEIHPLFHHIVLYYLIGMYYDKEGEGDAEESGLAQRYFNRFDYMKQMALARLNNVDSEGPVETLDVMPKRNRRHHSCLEMEDKDGYV